jgi:hypothetical protein
MDYSFAKIPGLRRDVPTPSGQALCIDGIETTELRRDARAALKKCGRQSRVGVYLAHFLLARRYARDLPRGVEVQNAVKDCLAPISCISKKTKRSCMLYGPGENPRALEKAKQTCNQYGIDVDYKRCSALGSRLV